MKKVIMMVMGIVMLFAFCGCNNTATEETDDMVPRWKIIRVDTQVGRLVSSYENSYSNLVDIYTEVVDYNEGLVKICLIAESNSDAYDYYGRVYLWNVMEVNWEQIDGYQAYGDSVESTIATLLAF